MTIVRDLHVSILAEPSGVSSKKQTIPREPEQEDYERTSSSDDEGEPGEAREAVNGMKRDNSNSSSPDGQVTIATLQALPPDQELTVYLDVIRPPPPPPLSNNDHAPRKNLEEEGEQKAEHVEGDLKMKSRSSSSNGRKKNRSLVKEVKAPLPQAPIRLKETEASKYMRNSCPKVDNLLKVLDDEERPPQQLKQQQQKQLLLPPNSCVSSRRTDRILGARDPSKVYTQPLTQMLTTQSCSGKASRTSIQNISGKNNNNQDQSSQKKISKKKSSPVFKVPTLSSSGLPSNHNRPIDTNYKSNNSPSNVIKPSNSARVKIDANGHVERKCANDVIIPFPPHDKSKCDGTVRKRKCINVNNNDSNKVDEHNIRSDADTVIKTEIKDELVDDDFDQDGEEAAMTMSEDGKATAWRTRTLSETIDECILGKQRSGR